MANQLLRIFFVKTLQDMADGLDTGNRSGKGNKMRRTMREEMSDKIYCKDCQWFNDGITGGTCHRMPPQTVRNSNLSEGSLHPSVFENDWCGMAERREEAEQEFITAGKCEAGDAVCVCNYGEMEKMQAENKRLRRLICEVRGFLLFGAAPGLVRLTQETIDAINKIANDELWGEGNKMNPTDFIKKHGACRDGTAWALSVSDDMADVWDALIAQGKREWLVWILTRPDVFPDSVLRKLACRFIRETPLHDGRKVWDLLLDERSRRAVEVAELYADGKATGAELKTARKNAYAVYDAVDTVYAANIAYATYAADYVASDAVYGIAAAVRAVIYATAYAADVVAARDAQIKMIADLGNPFKEE